MKRVFRAQIERRIEYLQMQNKLANESVTFGEWIDEAEWTVEYVLCAIPQIYRETAIDILMYRGELHEIEGAFSSYELILTGSPLVIDLQIFANSISLNCVRRRPFVAYG